MTVDEIFMHRCLQLAANGRGFVSPNPMVGSVVLCDGKIIGEGFHRHYGGPHAEVNAIGSVSDKALLKKSTLYVSLEPCSHYGKTPPCAQMIIDKKIPNVVIGCVDPYPAVSGRGIRLLRDAGINVKIGVLEDEAMKLNKEFITAQLMQRPYIYLKWAQTADGFIDKIRLEGTEPASTPISDSFSKMLVHKKRAETDAILVGTNTAIKDNPALTTRLWYGKNPVRVVIDRNLRIPLNFNLYNNCSKTLIYTEQDPKLNSKENIEFIKIDFDKDLFSAIFQDLVKRKVNSLLVEGGKIVLDNLIQSGLWDEAFIEYSSLKFVDGVKAPFINGNIIDEFFVRDSKHVHLKRL